MKSLTIPRPFVFLNLEKAERKRKKCKNLNISRKEEKMQKLEYLKNEKSFFDEIKNFFHSF